jgi:glycosyltransferase involved in cell wall biosynthesis
MSKKVVLTMIVKDEEHVISRALESCYRMIDSYCIVDTGSTDKTKEVIKDFFDSKNIEGKIIDFPFTNFEESRNQSIIHAQDLGDIGFWMDADEILELSQDFTKEKLNHFFEVTNNDQYLVTCDYNKMIYTRSQFYSLHKGFKWYGPVHEVLITDEDITAGKFELGKMIIIPDGASWKSDLSVKYEDHGKILEKYQEENGWKDPRWTFYLAQSYKDSSNCAAQKGDKERCQQMAKKAIDFYKMRIEDGKEGKGFHQEVYYSQLMIARLKFHFDASDVVLDELMLCEEFNTDGRVEHIFNIVSYLQSKKYHKNALVYAKEGLKMLKAGTKASLFLESGIYNYLLYDCYGVSLYYTGQFEEAIKYFEYAIKKLDEFNSTDPNRKRIENNIKSAKSEIERRREGNN